MPLVLSSLTSSLESQWLVPEGGSYPASANESGEKFATAVAGWFSMAMAAGFPCTTAMARKSQLASAAGAAFATEASIAAGNMLALGMALYIVGQSFGSGVAGMPIAQSAAGALFGATFADTNSGISAKAQQIASGCLVLAISTIVVFTTPPFAAPVS